LESAFLGIRADGNIDLKIIPASGTPLTYTLTAVDADDTEQHRVPVGRGMKAVYWKLAVAGQGAGHQVNYIKILPAILKEKGE